MTEQGQKPLSLLTTAGHRHDSPRFQRVLERIRVPRTGPGRPRTTPDRVRADEAYGSRANRSYPRRHGRPPALDKDYHKERHIVECGIN
ncbi:transposase [Streptomyces sp. NPDC127039]|uniref:transposase n=1 Tax=Streptomyces sp. NPDC127039 TaxID=3347115 RepID=UPI0036608BA0